MLTMVEIAKTIGCVNKDECSAEDLGAWWSSLLRARYWRSGEAKDFMLLWAEDMHLGIGLFMVQEKAEDLMRPNTILDEIKW